MANNNFVVKNGITVNGSFTANSTVVNAAAVNTTSVNATTTIAVGANVTLNTTAYFVGNSSVNTNITAATILISGVNVNTMISGNAATAYTNATSYADAKAAAAYSNAVANAAALYQTTAGLSANVAVLTANAATYLGNSSGTIANVASWVTGNAATAYTNAVSNAAALYQTTAGLSANVLNLSANLATYLGNSATTGANVASWISGNSATAYSNAVANAAAIYAPKNIPSFTGTVTASGNVVVGNSTYGKITLGNKYLLSDGTNIATNASFAINNQVGAGYLGIGPTGYWYGDTNMSTNLSCYAPNFVINSDVTLKENIVPIFSTSLLVDSIEPKQYDLIDGDKNELGFIAQEVEAYIPEAVIARSDGKLGIKHMAMIAVLWEALRETRAELAELKMRVG
jgi:hypothetical protein